jgi:hypothetical protein
MLKREFESFPFLFGYMKYFTYLYIIQLQRLTHQGRESRLHPTYIFFYLESF